VILSTAKYYSPGGKAIQDTGVTPEVAVLDSQAGMDFPDDDSLPPAPAPQKTGEDTILKKAIELLTSGSTPASTSASLR
jgi:carboxyl-terminal processing protease